MNLRELRDEFLEKMYGNTGHGVRWSILEEFIRYTESRYDRYNEKQPRQQEQPTTMIISEKDAARILNRDPKTLRRWRQKCVLPFIRLGSRPAYTPEILEQFLKQTRAT